MAIGVFLADDHAVVRDGLRFLLEAQNDITVTGEAADGREAVRSVQQNSPNVVVMDIAMAGLNGIDATQQIRETCPSTQVVILSMHANSEYIFRALKAGALGYVLKESAGNELVEAVRTAHRGRRFLSRRITETVIDDYVSHHNVPFGPTPMDRLSAREREILQLVAEGQSSSKIAETLFLSVKTVETYRSRLMQKLGIKDIPSLVKFAIKHGLTFLE
jgi:DNA-binding NarL/FixJ family response regulator